MQTLIQNNRYSSAYERTALTAKKGLITKFMDYTESQEKNRILWTGISLLGHGTVFTILTLMVVVATGNNFAFWISAAFNIAVVVIVNLAALPTRITIPIFFLSLLMDAAIVAACLLS